MRWSGAALHGLQILNLEFTVAFVVITDINAFHKQRTVMDLISQGQGQGQGQGHGHKCLFFIFGESE